MAGEEDAIEKEKKEITDKIREAKKAGMSSKEMAYLQTALERLAWGDSRLTTRSNDVWCTCLACYV